LPSGEITSAWSAVAPSAANNVVSFEAFAIARIRSPAVFEYAIGPERASAISPAASMQQE